MQGVPAGNKIPSDIRLHLSFAESMGIWKQISEYLYLSKPDPERPKSQWIGYMHGINRLSILLFILALIILAVKIFL